MKKAFFTALAWTSLSLLNAQTPQAVESMRTLTLEEYTAGSPKFVHPKNIYGLQWLGNELLERDATAIKIRRPEEAQAKELLSLSTLNKLLQEAGGKQELKEIPYDYIGLEDGHLRVQSGNVVAIIDPKQKKLVKHFLLSDEAQASLMNKQHTHEAYVKRHNLYIQSAEGKTLQLTTDGSEQIVYGQSVHQNEFGINGGLFWSEDGSSLAFYRMDQSMVKPYPILHINARQPYGKAQYYPMAGTKLHHVKLGVYHLASGQTIYLDTPDPSKTYLTNITWSPDGREIYIAQVNREQTKIDLVAYDSQTGKSLRTLFSESNEKYAEPLHGLYFLPQNPKLFVWQSRRDGFNHLYLYNTEGKFVRQITKGTWEVTNFYGFSQDNKTLYFEATEVSPLERHLYSIKLNGGKATRLSQESGWHQVTWSHDKRYFVDSYERQDVGRAIKIKSNLGKTLTILQEESNPDASYLTPRIELGTIKAADNTTDLHYRLIKPYNFDKNKKYPTIIYVYNGPHAQLVQNRYRGAARGWELNMANEGYIIFTVDGRGSAHRGAAFEQVIHRQLGKHEMADQMKGVEFLTSLPYVDAHRLGVYGWSFGGFMTTNLMLSHGDTFKVGVAGGPVIDWARYEIMYGERYMDTPQENPEGYKGSNLLLRAGNLKGRLMLIHGSIDPVVIWQHSLLFLEASVRSGAMPDYMVYPEHEHNVLGPDRVHLNKVITRYFKDHL